MLRSSGIWPPYLTSDFLSLVSGVSTLVWHSFSAQCQPGKEKNARLHTALVGASFIGHAVSETLLRLLLPYRPRDSHRLRSCASLSARPLHGCAPSQTAAPPRWSSAGCAWCWVSSFPHSWTEHHVRRIQVKERGAYDPLPEQHSDSPEERLEIGRHGLQAWKRANK